MLITIFGDIRQGKTSLTAIFAYDSKKEVWSNFKLDIPNYHKLDYDNLLNLPNNVDVFIDEAYTWLESRKSGKDTNVLASHILFQSGKRTINIYLNTQLLSTIDLRFRDMSNVLIECFKHETYQLFQYDIYVKHKGIFYFNKSVILPFSKAEQYFKIFDTFEIVKSDLTEKFELDDILNDSKKLYRYIQDLSVQVKPLLKGKKTTLGNIELAMIRLEYSELYIKKFKRYVQNYLNENKK